MRREKIFVVTDDGRDHGKTFFLTEMSAVKCEEWAERALGIMIRGGVDMPDLVTASGMSGVVSIGFMALFSAPFTEIKPLLDQLMDCVEYFPDSHAAFKRKPLLDDEIEEAATLVRLRLEVFELCAGFSVAAAFSTLRAKMMAAQDTDLNNTLTSDNASEQ